MIGKVLEWFGAPAADASGAPAVSVDVEDAARLTEKMAVLNADPYLHLVTEDRLLSVFDDLKYDRADADWMSGARRGHAIRKLKPLGFRQVSGTVLQSAEGVRLLSQPEHGHVSVNPDGTLLKYDSEDRVLDSMKAFVDSNLVAA